MMAKGRPPVKKTAPTPQPTKGFGPIDMSEAKMSMPTLKKSRAKAKKHDINNFDFD